MLKDILVSEVRVKILKVVLTNLDTPMHVRELTRRVGTEINAVRRELSRLTKAGLLRRVPKGNRVYFEVNYGYVFFDDLLSMVLKEVGLGGEILRRKTDLGKIMFAYISKAFVRGREASPNDVDLVLVGAVDMRLLGEIVKVYEEKIGREINYTVMGEDEYDFRKKRKDPFLMQIISEPKIVLVGEEEKYCSL